MSQPITTSVIKENRPKCGIVMPISPMDDLSADHWAEVKGLIVEVADECGYDCDLVSAADFSGVIQKRIVQNLYSNDIVICDVSKQNANVMFELGLRLAFDKATIVIVDDETNISFDTSPIEHLKYPRDLRHGKILAFKEKLKILIKGTADKSKEPGYSTFLKDFGTFEVKGLESKDIQFNEFVMSGLEKLSDQMNNIMSQQAKQASLMNPELRNFEIAQTNMMIRRAVTEVLNMYENSEFYGNHQERNNAISEIKNKLLKQGIDVGRTAIDSQLSSMIQGYYPTN